MTTTHIQGRRPDLAELGEAGAGGSFFGEAAAFALGVVTRGPVTRGNGIALF
jgi:hypothetical protein